MEMYPIAVGAEECESLSLLVSEESEQEEAAAQRSPWRTIAKNGVLSLISLLAVVASGFAVSGVAHGAIPLTVGPSNITGNFLKAYRKGGPCLCLFDVDRTLTSKQNMARDCPGSEAHKGVRDPAFGGGDIVLSPVGTDLELTACGQCHRGIVSAGDAGDPDEKAVLQQKNNFPDAIEWSFPHSIKSPLVRNCRDAEKGNCAKGIVDWFADAKQIVIAPHNVFFFDDHTGNTRGFEEHGFNAQQISCASRDQWSKKLGGCGAQVDEIVLLPGVHNCDTDCGEASRRRRRRRHH